MALAVSGGADSLALLLLAAAARPDGVIAATVDHGLRPDAAAEARHVGAICDRLAVGHAVLPVRVADGAGPQAAARAARYAALAAWALAAGATALATAHHVDDQAETLLLRLARGSGVGGLAGIRPVRALGDGLSLVRPLLGWRRAELAMIVAAAGIVPVDDPSNRDPRYDRTRARALLAGRWPDPARLAATAAHLREAEAALAWTAARELALRAGGTWPAVTLDRHDLPDELLRRVVALLLAGIPGAGVARRPATGPELSRFIARLAAGEHATLGAIAAAPGPLWRFYPAPPHRSK